jgi:hypothetical protein
MLNAQQIITEHSAFAKLDMLEIHIPSAKSLDAKVTLNVL